MPIKVDGETYYTASEAAKYLGISRPTFYQNIQPNLSEYKPGAIKRIYYRQRDLDTYKGIDLVDPNKSK